MKGLFLSFDATVPGVDVNTVPGLGLWSNLQRLDEITQAAGVPPLSCFIDGRSMLEEVLGGAGDLPDVAPPPAWHAPEEGLATVRALLSHLQGGGDTFPLSDLLRSDLENMEAALTGASRAGARFHLLFDL